MRNRLIAVVVTLGALAFAAAAFGTLESRAKLSPMCKPGGYELVNDGVLTVGTDNPAFPPWFGGGEIKGSKWQINDPSTGKGYESAVAYAVAQQLGFKRSQVEWTYVPFNRAYAPGKKPFDFDINQISITPARAKVATFSAPYYDANQAIVVLNGTDIAKAKSVAGLREFKLGAQIGTTSYDFIKNRIKPTESPAVFPQNAGAIQALRNGQIDGLVVDLPTAFYVTGAQVENSTVLGQFAASSGERFGMVLPKDRPVLTRCVNEAVRMLKANGSLQRMQQQWLAKATGAPVLK